MTKYRKLILIIMSFIVGFSFGINAKVLYEASSFKPYEWESPPIIVNCYGKEFNKMLMEKAIEYWKIRGEKIGIYEHSPSENICEAEWIEGFIILRKSEKLNQSESTIASTRRYTSFAITKGAVINYKPGSYNLNLINEHELGHALGFMHVNIEGHIMHPLYHKMGRDFWIPVE